MQNENILNCGLHLGYNFKRNATRHLKVMGQIPLMKRRSDTQKKVGRKREKADIGKTQEVGRQYEIGKERYTIKTVEKAQSSKL